MLNGHERRSSAMRAVVIQDFGTAPEVTEIETPEPGPGEVLVRMRAAGMNPFDWKVVDGALRDVVDHAFPLVLGSDGAGDIAAVGPDVTAFAPGERVFGQFMRVDQGRGSYAEYALATVADGKLARTPDELSDALAAALPTAGTTGYQTVATTGIGDGQVLLINGASGGVGQGAVQFAARKGANVIATGMPGLADLLHGLGATQVIDFTAGAVIDQVRRSHPDGIDAIIDLVATPEEIRQLGDLLRPGGVLVTTNYGADPEAFAARGRRAVNFGANVDAATLTALAEAVISRDLLINLDAEIPLDAVPETIERARSGHARGKTVILP
jgi:NADPH:quinone reductase-like Zn-dependent oxidoreductase